MSRTVADLDLIGLRAQLREGLRLRTSPFTLCLHSRDAAFAAAFQELYGGYRLADQDVADIDLHLAPPNLLRRFVRPQVMGFFDTAAPFNPLPKRMGLMMLEQSQNWCVASRTYRFLVMHAAVLEREGRALILPGRSGAGKTTLCAALSGAGWRQLSDEFTIIDLQTGQAVPYPRPMSLKNQSIELVKTLLPDRSFSETITGTFKGNIAYMAPSAEALAHAEELVTPAWIIMPEFHAGTEARHRTLSQEQLFIFLTASSVNYDKLGADGFAAMRRLVSGVSHRAIQYPDTDSALGLVAELTGYG